MIVGLAINNITNIFQKSGILRLQMTVRLIKIIEDFLMAFQKIIPLFASNVKLMPKLRYVIINFDFYCTVENIFIISASCKVAN